MHKKTICLNMIVKNESKVIRTCLDSVKPILDDWVIVDTGSDDGTQALIREILKEIPGELHERPWVDFAHNRNEALALAQGKADYLLFIDADERAVIQSFHKNSLCQQAYCCEVFCSGSDTSARICLLKNGVGATYTGVIHEYLEMEGRPLESYPLSSISLDLGDKIKDAQERLQELELLEKALAKEPDNSRYVYFLAETHSALGRLPEALSYYQKRAAMGGEHAEQIFWSLYSAGICQEQLCYPPDVWLQSYHAAFKFYPSRAEPLHRMAHYFSESGNYTIAYQLAKAAYAIPKPLKTASITPWVYDLAIPLLVANSAYHLGFHPEAINIYRKLLKQQQLSSECEARIKERYRQLR